MDLTIEIGNEATLDLSTLSHISGLTGIDALSATDTAMTITAADVFATNDSTGNITLNTKGTDGANDTLDLSCWTEVTKGTAYAITGNFDGLVNDETYTINVTDVSVTI